jgi:MFS family permease
LFVSLEELLINCGILLAYFAGLWLNDFEGAWRYIIGIGIVLPSFTFGLALMPQVPESPRFLFFNSRHAEAEATLRRLVDANEVRETLAGWEEEKHKLSTPLMERIRQTPRGVFLAGVGLVCAVNCSGVHPIHTVLSSVLAKAGGMQNAPSWGFGITLAKLCLLFPVCLYFVDHAGRRPLIMTSATCMAISALVTTMALASHMSPHVAMFGVAMHLVSFSLGSGPASWAYVSEVFATEVRSIGVGLALCAGRFLVMIQLALFLPIMEYQSWLPFSFYVMTNIAAVTFVYFNCPETKGVPLENVNKCF